MDNKYNAKFDCNLIKYEQILLHIRRKPLMLYLIDGMFVVNYLVSK